MLYFHQQKMGHFEPAQDLNNGRDSIYFCDFKECGKGFMSKKEQTVHRMQHLKPFKCSYSRICTKSFAKRYDLKIHERTHCELQSEKCTFCGTKFRDPANLRKHIRGMHLKDTAVKPYVCKYCHKQFSRKESLQKHFQTHFNHLTANDRLFECEKCAGCFVNKSNLSKHCRTIHGH